MRSEESRKKAEVLAASNAKRLEDSRATLLDCMREAKVALDAVFVKAGSKPCDDLPDADPVAFSAWLKAEVSQLVPLLDSVSDFGAYSATLTVARSFQATSCTHLKKLGCVNHNFPSVDDVRGAATILRGFQECVRMFSKEILDGRWRLSSGVWRGCVRCTGGERHGFMSLLFLLSIDMALAYVFLFCQLKHP